MEDPAVYTVTEVSELLKCDPRTVRNMIERGDLRGVRVGRDYRVTKDSVDAFLTLSGRNCLSCKPKKVQATRLFPPAGGPHPMKPGFGPPQIALCEKHYAENLAAWTGFGESVDRQNAVDAKPKPRRK